MVSGYVLRLYDPLLTYPLLAVSECQYIYRRSSLLYCGFLVGVLARVAGVSWRSTKCCTIAPDVYVIPLSSEASS
jgi:hypothetical protein